VTAFAGDDGAKRNVVVVGENGEKATFTLDGSRLTMTAEEGDDISVREVDLAEIAALVDDALAGAMVGMEAALDALAESDIQVHVDPDHRIVVQADGESTSIDLAAVMDAVSAAMQEMAGEFDADAADEGELQREIAELRAEIEALQAELHPR
jgi:diacylglycerol kinase family enzyme